MRRREFIVGLGSAAAWPLAVRAQQPTLPVIGIMGAASAQGFAIQVATIRQGLGEMGFVEGQNLTIEFRWAEDRFERLPALAADLVGRQVAVIVTAGGTATAIAAKNATSTIPIVFALGFDPIQTGVVTSLNRGGRDAYRARWQPFHRPAVAAAPFAESESTAPPAPWRAIRPGRRRSPCGLRAALAHSAEGVYPPAYGENARFGNRCKVAGERLVPRSPGRSLN
jgi:hypothetical protein